MLIDRPYSMRTPRNIWQIHYRHTGNSDRLMETSYNIEAAMMDNHSPSFYLTIPLI